MSALRYPGGKTRAVKTLLEYLPSNVLTLYSPFLGGGSFEIACSNKNDIKVIANDIFEPLMNFYLVVQNNNDKIELCEKLKEMQGNISKDDLMEYRKYISSSLSDDDERLTKITKATKFFAINRCSFSGSTFSGGFSEQAMKGRFTLSSIERLKKCDFSSFTFYNMDFELFLKQYVIADDSKDHSHSFIYADPPYMLVKENSNLYGVNGSLHQNFDHDRLFRVLDSIDTRWMLSYNDCPKILNLYAKYRIVKVSWSYGMSKDKIGNEILIFNWS